MYSPILRRRSLTIYRYSNCSDTIPTFNVILPNSSSSCVSGPPTSNSRVGPCLDIDRFLFVESERVRYSLAKAVVELCRNEGFLEEVECAKIFTEDITTQTIMVRSLAPYFL